MATYDLIGLGDGAGRPFHSIDVEHQLHLLKASNTDVADVLRSGFQLNLAATAASTKVAAEGMSQMSGQLAAIDEGLAGLAGDVRDGFADLAAGQQEIAAALSSGFQAVASELVAHRALLDEIRGLLDELVRVAANPRTTQGAELSRQARANLEDALKLSGSRRSRLLDEAFDLLTESVQFNAQDFEAQFNLGWVCLVHRHDPARAAEQFDTVVLRSLTRSPSFAAYASRHLALAQREAGDLPAALTAAAEAAVNAPDDAVTLLDHARYAALAGAPEAAEKLRRAIAASPQCWYEAAADPDFASLGAALDAVLDHAREQARQAVTDLAAEVGDLLVEHVFTVADVADEISRAKDESETALHRGRYADLLAARAVAEQTRTGVAAALERLVPTELGTVGSGVGSEAAITACPNGWVLAWPAYKSVQAWSLPEWGRLADLTDARHSAVEVALSRDGRVIAGAFTNGSVRVWSLPQGRELAVCPGYEGWFAALALSWDGRVLAVGPGRCTRIDLWFLTVDRQRVNLNGHSEVVRALAISPDGRVLASGSDDSTVRLWSLPEGRALATLTGHTGDVRALAISPDGRVLASGGHDSTVRLWSLPEGRLLATLATATSLNYALAVGQDGLMLAVAGFGRTCLWGLATALMPAAQWAVLADTKRAIEARERAKAEEEVRAKAAAAARAKAEEEVRAKRENEEARAKAEAERQRRLKAEARCLGCERPLGFLDKLAGRSRHAGC